jgi:hypothetical protein
MLVSRPARRNGYTPSPGRNPLPDSHSEFRNGIVVTHASGQTRYPGLAFDADPCDLSLWQRVEGVTFERRATGRENDDDRFVRHAQKLVRDR